MVLSVERQMIAAVLQAPELLQRLRRAKIEPSDIKDIPSQAILSAILECHKYGEITGDSVKTIIQDDRGLKADQKTLYSRVVDELIESEIDQTEFSFAYFARCKQQAQLQRALATAVEDLRNRSDSEKVREDLLKKLSSGIPAQVDLKVYEDTAASRERERRTQATGEGMLRFPHEFRHLQKYFPFGLARETMTCIQGSTNAGKSVFLANMVWMATLPENKLNVLYVFSENREVEALSRLDAVVLDKPYAKLYSEYLTNSERQSIRDRQKEGYGRIFYCKPEFESFDVSTIEQAIEEAANMGYQIDVVAIDSPDHMRPSHRTNQTFQDKPQVWKDLKALMHKYKFLMLGTWPLREEYSGAGKAGKEPPALHANSGAYGQDVARVMDNIIAFSYDERSDDLMSHRLFVVTKCRDGKKDFAQIRYRVMDTLRFIHVEDFNAKYQTEDLQSAFTDTAY